MRAMKRFVFGLVAGTLALTAAPAAAQEFFVLPPSASVQCYQTGYWMWDGVQHIWVPTDTICQYQ